MALSFGKIEKFLSKKFITFFLFRFFGACLGLILVSYQYTQSAQLKLYFHHFPSLLILVYLTDFGYSEILTKTGNKVSIQFLKKLFYLLLIISFFSLVFSFLPIENNYKKWLLFSIVFVPFQAYFDVCYRIMLRNNLAVYYLFYQLLYPLIVLLSLHFFIHKISESSVFKVFIGLTVLVQLLYILFIYIVRPNLFEIDQSATKYRFSITPFLLKIAPLLIYEIFTDVYVLINPTESALGLELIRSQYFVMGIILLLFYVNDVGVVSKFQNNFFIFFLLLLLLSLSIACTIINVKEMLRHNFEVQNLKIFPFNYQDILFGLLGTVAASIYLTQYSKWLRNNYIG